MSEFNNYPVFVADQVLTADHLNEIVNYLEEQERLTRNKLIGIGIVCGLELKVSAAQIDISKGCGITSEGYLIVQDSLSLTHYQPYEVPADFFPKYKPVYDEVTSVNDSVEWTKYELLTKVQSLDTNNPIALTSAFLQNKIVVLLLEMRESPLKNCVDTDCDDKGDKVQFSVKPLLVDKNDISAFLKSLQKESSETEPVLLPIQLKRYNVPVTSLDSSYTVLNAFVNIMDDETLKTLADALNYCYIHYKSILPDEPVNPFTNNAFTLNNLKGMRDFAKGINAIGFQYLYDWMDDLIKAYYEFKNKVFEVQTICCPDGGLFPLHLMLGEASLGTSIEIHSSYRNYLISSPLLNNESEKLAEVQLLFKRMKLMLKNYTLPPLTAPLKITPSKYPDRPLSERAIPYYYIPFSLHGCWNWDKTRKGNAWSNLSYWNDTQHNFIESVVNPLLYDLDRFNFFRIEGLIGKNISTALNLVITERDQKNLPFDVVALSTTILTAFTQQQDYDCMLKDMESIYQVLLSELNCKFHELTCNLASAAYLLTDTGVPVGGGSVKPADDFTSVLGLIIFSKIKTSTLPLKKYNGPIIMMSFEGDFADAGYVKVSAGPKIIPYKRGDYLASSKCGFGVDTIGTEYLRRVGLGEPFSMPSPNLGADYPMFLYLHFFYLLDCIDQIMAVAFPFGPGNSNNPSLEEFDSSIFNTKWDAFTDEIKNFLANYKLKTPVVMSDTILVSQLEILLHSCFDDQFTGLKNEYLKRVNEIQLMKNIVNYSQKHRGMEHKAGVPKGGTFILVYHELPQSPLLGAPALIFSSTEQLPVIADFCLPYRCCSDCG